MIDEEFSRSNYSVASVRRLEDALAALQDAVAKAFTRDAMGYLRSVTLIDDALWQSCRDAAEIRKKGRAK